MKRILFIILGCITVILGTIGIFIPLLPTVPFYMATAYFWLNSSKKLHAYFVKTTVYQKYVKEIVIDRKLDKKKRRRILIVLFLLLSVPFIMVSNTIMRLGLLSIFIGHVIFFSIYFPHKEKAAAKKIVERVDI